MNLRRLSQPHTAWCRRRHFSVKMALPGVSLVPLRALCYLAKCVHTGGNTASIFGRGMRWYKTKARSFEEHSALHIHGKRGEWTQSLAMVVVTVSNFKDTHHVKYHINSLIPWFSSLLLSNKRNLCFFFFNGQVIPLQIFWRNFQILKVSWITQYPVHWESTTCHSTSSTAARNMRGLRSKQKSYWNCRF